MKSSPRLRGLSASRLGWFLTACAGVGGSFRIDVAWSLAEEGGLRVLVPVA